MNLLNKKLIKQVGHLFSSFSIKGAQMINKADIYSFVTRMKPTLSFPPASCLQATKIFCLVVLKIRTATSQIQLKTQLLKWSLISHFVCPHHSPLPLQALHVFNQTAPAHMVTLPCNLPNRFTFLTGCRCQEQTTLAYVAHRVCFPTQRWYFQSSQHSESEIQISCLPDARKLF